MKKFVLTYTSPVSAEERMKGMNPEDSKKGMDLWMAWFEKNKSALVEMGAPLGHGMSYFKNSERSQPHVSGYSIVQAESMDDVKKMIADHPHYMVEGSGIDVFEILPMPGM